MRFPVFTQETFFFFFVSRLTFFLHLPSYLFHSLTYIVPRIRGLLYFIVPSTSTLEIECPALCSPVLCQRCFQAFNFKSFPMHSNHAFLGPLLGLLPVTILSSTFLAMCLDPYVEDYGTNKDANISVHFLCYTDQIDFLVYLMVSCL